AIYCHHQLVHGARFRAGEFGYMLTDRPGGRDPRRSSMNENCTLRVLRPRYAEPIAAPLESVTGEMIFDRYDAGDAVCQRL
ncbi:ROK family protein, partial [Klebsiella pneumoniae]|nr:ROK family protein [Klebsiella pneumoniae]